MKNSIVLFSNYDKLLNVFDPDDLMLEIFPKEAAELSKNNWILNFNIESNVFVPVSNNLEELHGIFVIYDGIEIEERNIIQTTLTKIKNSSGKVILVFHTLPEETVREKICDLFGTTKGLVLPGDPTHEHPNNYRISKFGYTMDQKNKLEVDDCFFYFKVYNALFDLYHSDKTEYYFDGKTIQSVDDIIRITISKLDKNKNLEIALSFLHKCLAGENQSLPNEFLGCQNEFDIWTSNKTNDHLGNLRDKILELAFEE